MPWIYRLPAKMPSNNRGQLGASTPPSFDHSHEVLPCQEKHLSSLNVRIGCWVIVMWYIFCVAGLQKGVVAKVSPH